MINTLNTAKSMTCVLMLAVLLFSVSGVADTFFLRSGVPVHGRLVRTDETHYYVQSGEREIRLLRTDVARIEENDNDGTLDRDAIEQRLEERERELYERTGLTREERDAIQELVRLLDDNDPVTSGDARRKLTAMAEDARVFGYIESLLPAILPVYLPTLLRVLAQADSAKALVVMRDYVSYPEQNTRASAVELLGVLRDESALPLMMRGLLDHEPVVRLAACTALAAIGAKEATPLLLANYNHPDLRVESYVREALSIIWNIDDAEEQGLTSKEDWEALWNENSLDVIITVDTSTLEPLVEPGTRFHPC